MTPASNVELTRVFYYDESRAHRNLEVPTVSRELHRIAAAKNTVIRKNIFGHRWVLKINEAAGGGDVAKDGCNAKVIVYVWVFCCLVVAVSFGVYFSLDATFLNIRNGTATVVPNDSTDRPTDVDASRNFKRANEVKRLTEENNSEEFVHTTTDNPPADRPSERHFCSGCLRDEEVCLKVEELDAPVCVRMADKRDPTGCGGLCKIDAQHCKLLDAATGVRHCAKNGDVLGCPDGRFSCGSRCLARERRCDGAVDCANMSDEIGCDCKLDTHFQCGNRTSCIENARKCDGVIDCWDRSDEYDCNRDCKEGEASCINGQCIDKEQFCDGTHHCADKSDEPEGCQL